MREKDIFEELYKLALKAYKKNEIPVSCIITRNGRIIAKAINSRVKTNLVIGHAEINCIIEAEKKVHDWRLDDCEMFVTLEPCEMCRSIIKSCRISKVNYLLKNNNDHVELDNYAQTNVCAALCINYDKLLKSFFKNLR